MLPKIYRLSGCQIPNIVKFGKRYHAPAASLILLPKQNSSSLSQFAVIIPKKLSKKATKRNRTKRLLNEAIYKNIAKIETGFEVLLMAKRILDKEKLKDIEPEVERLFNKAGLLSNNLKLKI